MRYDGICKDCPPYQKGDSLIHSCVPFPPCKGAREYLTADGECHLCSDYTKPSADGK